MASLGSANRRRITDKPDEALPPELRADQDRLAALATEEICAEMAHDAHEGHAFGKSQIRRGRDLFSDLGATLKRRVCPGNRHRTLDPSRRAAASLKMEERATPGGCSQQRYHCGSNKLAASFTG